MAIYFSSFHLCSPFTVVKTEGGIETKPELGTTQKVTAFLMSASCFAVVSGSIALLVFFGPMHFSSLGVISYTLAVPGGFFAAAVTFYVITYIQKKQFMQSLRDSEIQPFTPPLRDSEIQPFTPPLRDSEIQPFTPPLRDSEIQPFTPPLRDSEIQPFTPPLRDSEIQPIEIALIFPVLEARQINIAREVSNANVFSFFEREFIKIANTLLGEGTILQENLNDLETRKAVCRLVAWEVIDENRIKAGDPCDEIPTSYLSIHDGRQGEIARGYDAEKNKRIESKLPDEEKPYLYSVWSSPDIPTCPVEIKRALDEKAIPRLREVLLKGDQSEPIVQKISVIADQINGRYLSHLNFVFEDGRVTSVYKDLRCSLEWENNPYDEAKSIHELFVIAAQRVAQALITQLGLQEDEDVGLPVDLSTRSNSEFRILILMDIFLYSQIDNENRIFFNSHLCIRHDPYTVMREGSAIQYFVNDLTIPEGEEVPQFSATLSLFKQLTSEELTRIQAKYVSKIEDSNKNIPENTLTEGLEHLITNLPYFNFAQSKLIEGSLTYPKLIKEGKQEKPIQQDVDVQVLKPIREVNIDLKILQEVGIRKKDLKKTLFTADSKRTMQKKLDGPQGVQNSPLAKQDFDEKLRAQFTIRDMKVADSQSCFFEAISHLIFAALNPVQQNIKLRQLVSNYILAHKEKFIDSHAIQIAQPTDYWRAGEIVEWLGDITIYTNASETKELRLGAIEKYAKRLPVGADLGARWANDIVIESISEIFCRPIHVYLHNRTYNPVFSDGKLCPQKVYGKDLPGIPFSLVLENENHFKALQPK